MKMHTATYMQTRFNSGKWQVVCRMCRAVGPERDSADEAARDLSAHYRGELKLKPLGTAK